MVPPRSRRRLTWLTAGFVLLVLLGGAPLDAWLHGHGSGSHLDGHVQVHGGDCHHQNDSPHDPACMFCTTARALGAAPCPQATTLGPLEPAFVLAARTRALPRVVLSGGVLGARGPPVLG